MRGFKHGLLAEARFSGSAETRLPRPRDAVRVLISAHDNRLNEIGLFARKRDDFAGQHLAELSA